MVTRFGTTRLKAVEFGEHNPPSNSLPLSQKSISVLRKAWATGTHGRCWHTTALTGSLGERGQGELARAAAPAAEAEDEDDARDADEDEEGEEDAHVEVV